MRRETLFGGKTEDRERERKRERDFCRKGETAFGVAAGMRLGSAINEDAGNCIRKLRRTCVYYIAHEDAIRPPLPWLIVIIRGRSIYIYTLYIYIYTRAYVSYVVFLCKPYLYYLLPYIIYYVERVLMRLPRKRPF